MTVIIGLVVLALFIMLGLAGFVVFALLKRLDTANQAIQQAGVDAMRQAREMQADQPTQLATMLASLADNTARTHASLDQLVKTVLVPPPVVYQAADTLPFGMPSQAEGADEAMWDHTDGVMPRLDHGPSAVMGYEHELDDNFDPDNPFGIPGMKSMVP